MSDWKSIVFEAILLMASIIIGGLRFFAPGHELSLWGSYEAAAHILVGALIASWYHGNVTAKHLLISITAIECLMFGLFLIGVT